MLCVGQQSTLLTSLHQLCQHHSTHDSNLPADVFSLTYISDKHALFRQFVELRQRSG